MSGNEFEYSQPLSIIYELPNEKKKIIVVNEALEILTTNRFYTFPIKVKSKKTGWANFSLGEWDMEKSPAINSGKIKFVGNSIYLD